MYENSKNILASFLSQENITVIFKKNIIRPNFDSSKRIINIPCYVISEPLMDMIIEHESGHAIWSESNHDKLQEMALSVCPENSGVGFSYLNIVEDIRIEKLMNRKFKGIKRDFYNGYKELLENDYFDIVNNPPTLLIDKINIYFKTRIVDPYIVSFTDDEMVFVNMCENIEEDTDIVAITKAIFDYCKQNAASSSKMQENEEKIQQNSASSDINEGESTDSSNFSDSDDNSNDSDISNTISETTETVATESSHNSYMPVTSSALERNMKLSVAENKYEKVKSFNCPSCLNLPIVHLEKNLRVDNYIEKIIYDFNEKSKDTVNIMVQQFLMKKAAREFERSRISKSGVIDPNKLFKYKTQEDIFKKNKIVKKGKSHAMIMFVDWSGSMQDSIIDTVLQLFEIVQFCRKLNIPHEVYLFSDNPKISIKANKIFKNNKIFDNFALINVFSSKMNNEEVFDMQSLIYSSCLNSNIEKLLKHTTPLDECITASIKLVNDYKRNSNIDIMNVLFLTDGESNRSEWSGDYSSSPFSSIVYNNKTYRMKVSATNTLLRILKDQTNCNLFGLMISDNRKSTMKNLNQDFEKYESFMKDGFVLMDNKFHGYDKFFLISGKQRSKNDRDITEFIDSKKTAKSLLTGFKNYSESTNKKKIMLRKFVDFASAQLED
jgi:hypothetical protein